MPSVPSDFTFFFRPAVTKNPKLRVLGQNLGVPVRNMNCSELKLEVPDRNRGPEKKRKKKYMVSKCQVGPS